MRSDAYKLAVPPPHLPTIPPVPTPLAYESVYNGTSPPSPSSFLPQMEGDSFYYPFSGNFPDDSDSSDVPSSSFYPFTPSSQSSCSTLQSPPPLSPVSAESPEWSLFSSYGNNLPRDLDFDALSPSFGDSEERGFFQDRLRQTDSKSPKHASSLLSNQWPYYNNCPHSDDGYPLFCPESPKPLCQRLDPIDIEDTALPPLPFAFHRPYGEDSDVAERRANNDCQETPETQLQQRKAELLSPHLPATVPPSFFPLMHRNSIPEIEGDTMDLDFPNFFDNAPPPSPSGRSYAALPDDTDALPSISTFNSPSDTNMDILDSPTLSLLSLPGADIDEDLLPPDAAVARPASQIKSSTYANPLLVLDDDSSSQQDNQRSPSPEPCALLDITHLRPEMQNDEEMRKVFGLLKRAKEKERAAKQLEAVVEREERVARSIGNDTNGSRAVNAVMDARRRTKKWKNKVREVAILLRLNLAQRGLQVSQDESGRVFLEPTLTSSSSVDASRRDENAMEVEQVEGSRTSSSSIISSKKLSIRSPQHLLVRMILDRHEPKYNPNLRVGLPSSKKTISPLRRSLITAEEMGNEDVLEYGDADDTILSKYSDCISSFNSSRGPQNTGRWTALRS
jgi:hypothetical protein